MKIYAYFRFGSAPKQLVPGDGDRVFLHNRLVDISYAYDYLPNISFDQEFLHNCDNYFHNRNFHLLHLIVDLPSPSQHVLYPQYVDNYYLRFHGKSLNYSMREENIVLYMDRQWLIPVEDHLMPASNNPSILFNQINEIYSNIYLLRT
ncbi:hypothetical protein BLOT_011296 [Blomia tropicalis]|nr:hypothetical protein BLOT_011296 [Blomia tropicalis]